MAVVAGWQKINAFYHAIYLLYLRITHFFRELIEAGKYQ
jgi:hypothetical protein